MNPVDLSKVNELFKRVGDTGQTDMRRRCIEVVKQFKAQIKNDDTGAIKELLSEIARKMESLPIG